MLFRRSLFALGVLALGACSEPAVPVAHSLARGFHPATASTEGLWVYAALTESDWIEKEGHWLAPNPFDDSSLPMDPGFDPRLRSVDGDVELVRPRDKRTPRGRSFRVNAKGIRLHLPDHEWPTEEFQIGYRIAIGEQERLAVPREDPAWRVRLGKLMSDAIPVWHHGPQTVRIEGAPGCRLEFATTCLGFVPPGLEDDPPEQKVSLYLDGKLYHSITSSVTSGVKVKRHRVQLPADLSGPVHLRFQVDRPGALTTIHNPVLTNASVSENPVAERSPVIVLFSADTFRADNMQAYGADFPVTPELDRFAEQSLVYENSWSPAAWTLPAHASMFSGLHPYQHGSTKKLVRLNDELVVLAEWLAKAGWRTGAVTNALYVSGLYGMDRGFEWFEERLPTDLEGTLSAALDFLEADDGRPTFLFVHTYRVHGPYKVSNATLDEYDEELGLSQGMRVLRSLVREKKEQKRISEEEGGPKPIPLRHINFKGQWFKILREHVLATGVTDPDKIEERIAHIARSLQRAYLGGVVDLDRAFGEFTDDLERLGVFDRGQLVFTSDHGEAFGEHDTMFHGHGVWDEVLRIPLVIHGRGMPVGRDARPASLIDLPATLAALAGLPAHPSWEGPSLLEPLPVRDHLFLFDCADESVASAVVLEDGLKIVFPYDGEGYGPAQVRAAFDLRADPAELDDLQQSDAERVARILGLRGEELLRALMPLVEPTEIEVSDQAVREMQALGY